MFIRNLRFLFVSHRLPYSVISFPFHELILLLQAELISLGGKDVDSQYVLARETLHKWKSESNCYLLIKDLHVDLKVRYILK